MIDLPEEATRELQEAISSSTLRLYRAEDLTGAAIGGCLKNVYAIAVGISDGLALGDNARATLITRCLNRNDRTGYPSWCEEDTFVDLVAGDLIATCMWSGVGTVPLARRLPEDSLLVKLLTSKKQLSRDTGQPPVFMKRARRQGPLSSIGAGAPPHSRGAIPKVR